MAESQRLQRMLTIDRLRQGGWWTKDTVAVVTGGNKGVGYEIARQLGRHGLTVVLAARDEDRGQNAADSLKARGLNVIFHQLDVTDDESIQQFAGWIKRELGGLNILINNAGIKSQEVNFENARDCIATNYVALQAVTTALLPLFRPSSGGGRIVNISSSLGSLKFLKSESVRALLSDEEHLSEDLINSLAAKFLEDVTAGRYASAKWAWAIQHIQYTESKAFVNAYTRVLAKSLLKDGTEERQVFVNAATPGWTKSDMTNHHEGAQAVEKGADTPVWLALLPRENYPNGKFFSNRQEAQF